MGTRCCAPPVCAQRTRDSALVRFSSAPTACAHWRVPKTEDTETVGVTEMVGVKEMVVDGVGVTEMVGVSERVGVSDGECDGEPVTEMEDVNDGEAEGVGLTAVQVTWAAEPVLRR